MPKPKFCAVYSSTWVSFLKSEPHGTPEDKSMGPYAATIWPYSSCVVAIEVSLMR